MSPQTENNPTPARPSVPHVPERDAEDRHGAANVARHQAEHIYQHNPPNQLKEDPASAQTEKTNNPYMQTHQPTFDWQKYHSAWQEYYQQYYHRYYSQQLKQAKSEPAPAQEPEQASTITGSDSVGAAPKTQFQQIRSDLLSTVTKRAKKLSKNQHAIPVASALIVGLLFIFLQYNRLLVAQVEAFISPGSTVNVSDTIIVDPSTNADVGSDPKLIIPKINVNVPVIYTVTTVDDNAVQTALENGVVRYNLPGANSVPGQAGNTVILGHSSNDVFDPGGYKFAFVLLDKLENGDLFYMSYQGKRYVYKVSDKKIIKPTEWQTLQKNSGKPTVVLVTCTPAGTAQSRLLVYGEQISPDPTSASTKPANNQDSNPAQIPGNSPTFFERLKDLLF